MALSAGDKCPQCKEGLLERTELGLSCSNCDYDETIGEVVKQVEKQKLEPTNDYRFKAFKMKIAVDDPEEGEILLQGCIIARSNNNSPHFQQMIDAINGQLEPWRAAQLRAQLEARDA